MPLYIFCDDVSQKIFNLDEILAETQSSYTVAILDPFDDDINQTNIVLPNSEVQKHSLAILLLGSYPDTLDIYQDKWYFDTVMIVSSIQTFNVEPVMEMEMIQNANRILLVIEQEYSNLKKGAHLYTSKPVTAPNRNDKVPLGKWDKEKFRTFDSVFPDRFVDFYGETVHIATDIDDFPLISLDDDDLVIGMNIDIVNAIGSWLNYTYTTTIQSPEATWDGLLNAVKQGGKNFTINYFTITFDRLQDFDNSVPYFWEGFGFALKTPPPLPAWLNLVYPFTWQVSVIHIETNLTMAEQDLYQR